MAWDQDLLEIVEKVGYRPLVALGQFDANGALPHPSVGRDDRDRDRRGRLWEEEKRGEEKRRLRERGGVEGGRAGMAERA